MHAYTHIIVFFFVCRRQNFYINGKVVVSVLGIHLFCAAFIMQIKLFIQKLLCLYIECTVLDENAYMNWITKRERKRFTKMGDRAKEEKEKKEKLSGNNFN